MVLVIPYDKSKEEVDGGGYVVDTIEAKALAKKLIHENKNIHFCELKVLKNGIDSKVIATSCVF